MRCEVKKLINIYLPTDLHSLVDLCLAVKGFLNADISRNLSFIPHMSKILLTLLLDCLLAQGSQPPSANARRCSSISVGCL